MPTSPAYDRFIKSMQVGYDQWHDGIGYDLDALAALTADERADARKLLAARAGRDWRDVEALEALQKLEAGTDARSIEATDAALRESLESGSIDARLRALAALRAAGKIAADEFDGHLAQEIRRAQIYGGLTPALDLVERYPSDVAKRALLDRCKTPSDVAVHCAAMLFYLAGIAREPFDWDHRPFFLRLNGDDRAAHIAAFEELCDRVGMKA